MIMIQCAFLYVGESRCPDRSDQLGCPCRSDSFVCNARYDMMINAFYNNAVCYVYINHFM